MQSVILALGLLGTASAASCTDSDSWHKNGNTAKDCAWVKFHMPQRCQVKGPDAVKALDACAWSCGTCSDATAAAAAPSIHVVTDELYTEGLAVEDLTVSPFWTEWRAGMNAAVGADVTYKNLGLADASGAGVDVDGYVAAIEAACAEGDALVIAVSVEEGTAAYGRIDAAIDACLDADPAFPIFSTAYDTYSNARLYGYVGSENYAVGQRCARALLFTADAAAPADEPAANHDAVSGRGPALAEPVAAFATRCPGDVCQVYWPALLRQSASGARLVAGLEAELASFGATVQLLSADAAEEWALYDPSTGDLDYGRVVTGNLTLMQTFEAESTGFTVLATSMGVLPSHKTLKCGSTTHGSDEWAIGPSSFKQGLLATSSATAAAALRAAGLEWRAEKGNNDAYVDAQATSTLIPAGSSAASERQLECTATGASTRGACAEGLYAWAFDEGEAQLAAFLSFAAYAEADAGGGSLVEFFSSACWTATLGATYGAPEGALEQFYYKKDDILAYVALFRPADGPPLLAVAARGTQGSSALDNWMSNLAGGGVAKKWIDCPGSPTDSADCGVHEGFYEAYEGLEAAGLVDRVKALAAATSPAPKVVVTGHSLGAAVAVVIANELSLRHGVAVHALHTEASPRVYAVETRDYLEARREFPYWRAAFYADPVATMPPDMFNWRHQGVEHYGRGAYAAPDTAPLDAGYPLFGDGTGIAPGLSYDVSYFSSNFEHHNGPGYLAIAGFVGHEDVCNKADLQPDPVDVAAYESCAALCEAKTGSAAHTYYGENSWWSDECWDYGWGGDCDYNCAAGYCRAAPFAFADYPSDRDCEAGTTRICCCDDFYAVDGVDVEVIATYGQYDRRRD